MERSPVTIRCFLRVPRFSRFKLDAFSMSVFYARASVDLSLELSLVTLETRVNETSKIIYLYIDSSQI